MPNKAYWSLVEDIMNTTTAVCKPAMEDSDEEEIAVLLEDIRARKEKTTDSPSKEITLAGLAAEFVQVAHETCESYRSAKTTEECQAIMDEISDTTADVFSCITSEFAEVFGEASRRFKEVTAEEESFFEELEMLKHGRDNEAEEDKYEDA